MRQIVLTAKETFEMREIPVPEITADQALVRVRAVGVCGSDIHAYYGEHPFMSFPIVLGHEMAGEIAKVGENVSLLKIGDRVVMRPQKVCGRCRPCRQGRYNICESLEVIGCQCTGGSSEYFAVDAGLLYRLPDNVDFIRGTVIEPLSVAVHAVKRGLADVNGKNILVLGAGTIGNLVAQSAKALGAAKVMITDFYDDKLEMARRCRIDCAVNTGKKELFEAVSDFFGDEGIDAVYECTASQAALNQVLDVAGKGIPIVIVGVFAGLPGINIANVQDREYSLIGTLMYVHEDYMEAIRLVENGSIDVQILISRVFPLEECKKAYEYIAANKQTAQKVVLSV